jgi:hypothetical protein
MRRFLVGTEISSSNIFFSGRQRAPIRGRVEARSGQNQLRAKRARRLTDNVRYEARRIAAQHRQAAGVAEVTGATARHAVVALCGQTSVASPLGLQLSHDF